MRDERFTAATCRALGGLLVWAAHFGFLYGFVGLACARGFAGVVPWTIGAATIVALAAAGFLLFDGLRGGARDFLDWLTAASAAIAAVAILWQAFPVLIVPTCG